MNKIIRCLFVVIAIYAIAPMEAIAESVEVQRMEGEIRGGFSTPIGAYHTGKAELAPSMGIEGRYNFKNTPWDCGLMLDLSSARRNYSHLSNDGYDHWQNNRTFAIATVGEYNLCQGSKINPFAGVATGISFNDVVGDKYYPSKFLAIGYLAPRIGIECFHHFRLMTQLNLSHEGYNNFSVTLGFVIGGRPQSR